MHLTPPSSFHLLITENSDSSNDNSSNKDKDTATAAADEDTDDAGANGDLFPMAKMAPKKRGAAAGGRKAPPKKSSAGRKTTGEETIDLDTPPRKKPSAAAASYLIEKRGCYTVNPYAHRSKNKIDVVLHEGGLPSKDAQPQVTLLLGGKTLSVQ